MKSIRLFLVLVEVLVANLVFAPGAFAADPDWIARGRQGMVASDHALASRAGLEVLQAGGNAIDAACAVSFALAVTRPESTGLGGGGFLIARLAEGKETVVLDFREQAPAAATPDMFDRAVRRAPDRAPPSRYGHLAAAVPTLLAGRVEILKLLGTRELAELIEPAIRLADKGYAVDEHYAQASRTAHAAYAQYPELRESCPYVYNIHLRQGDLRKPGDVLRQPELAKLLRNVAERGPEFFYSGPVAEAIEREMQVRGGIITKADLAQCRVVQRKPLVSRYRGYEIITMPPPSSGGVCLIEALNILSTADLPALRRTDPPLAAHLTVEAMKHAFADRARWLGDADFVSVPLELLTSPTYARDLAARLDPAKTLDNARYGSLTLPTTTAPAASAPAPNDSGTSHFCVVDRWGNCVSSTETVNTYFGSLAAVAEWGLILNNEMDDFTAHADKANAFELLQSERNAPQPGKRPLSSMTPTIVLRDGQPVLMLGASGGPRIISSVLAVLTGVLDGGLPLEEAMSGRRIHHQWQPDEVGFDAIPPAELADTLRNRGHRIADRRSAGAVQAITVTPDGLTGASDPRKGGRPAGY